MSTLSLCDSVLIMSSAGMARMADSITCEFLHIYLVLVSGPNKDRRDSQYKQTVPLYRSCLFQQEAHSSVKDVFVSQKTGKSAIPTTTTNELDPNTKEKNRLHALGKSWSRYEWRSNFWIYPASYFLRLDSKVVEHWFVHLFRETETQLAYNIY